MGEPPTAVRELQAWPHWVCWRTIERDGKPTKVPLQPNGRPASSTDPGTWSSHADCVKALERGRFDGIGYVFAEDDEYAGVDLDHCVTDGAISFSARIIIDRLASYTELSPSGTGVHVIVRAGLNGGRKRTGKTPWGGEFENYDRGRFFTVTGLHVKGTPEKIEARQAELDEIRAELFPEPAAPSSSGRGPLAVVPVTASDSDIIDKIRKSKQGRTFEPLWDGDTGAHGDDESAADLALCNILAFWFATPERIDSVFRQSGLMREKWDEQRGDQTYGQMTVSKSLEGRTEFYGQRNGPRRPPAGSDDSTLSYEDEISSILGLLDDPVVSGWRSSRKANARVVLTVRSGAELDLESWKAATGTPKTLAQEVRLQLGADVTLKQENLNRLDVLVSRYCSLVRTTTVDDRACELGGMYLQEAEQWIVDLLDQASRWEAFRKMKERHPPSHARAESIGLAAAGAVLVDQGTGKRYVRIQWFVDYVKANATGNAVAAVLEAIERPDNWSRLNAQSRLKATNPETGENIWQVLYEVPAGWETAGDSK
jgi:hypothetical protein